MKNLSSKARLTALILVAFGTSSQAATNSADIDVSGGTVKTITVKQAATTGNNSIGSSTSDFAVKGGWQSISIQQTYDATAPLSSTGNNVTGSVSATSGSTASSLAIVQKGADNAISLNIGSTVALTNPTLSFTQNGTKNSSSYTMDNSGATNVTESLQGDNNTVSVTSTAAAFNSDVNVTGNSNQVSSNRATGSYGDSFTVYGNSNSITLTGSATGSNSAGVTIGATGAGFDSNTILADQSGANNAFTVALNGGTNSVDIGQSSLVSSSLDVSLTGSGNSFTSRQSGSNAVASVKANGSGNIIGLTQSAGNTNAVIDIAATNANVSVTQATQGATYSLAGQLTTGATVTVNQ